MSLISLSTLLAVLSGQHAQCFAEDAIRVAKAFVRAEAKRAEPLAVYRIAGPMKWPAFSAAFEDISQAVKDGVEPVMQAAKQVQETTFYYVSIGTFPPKIAETPRPGPPVVVMGGVGYEVWVDATHCSVLTHLRYAD